MTPAIAERHRWVVDMLDVDPDDHLLEIGCGHGIVVSLICEKLDSGKIVAIDRSEDMVARAAHKNYRAVNDGKAEFHLAGLAHLDLNGERFHKVFAVNVNLFWTRPAATELGVVQQLLQPSGCFYLMYAGEPPMARRTGELADVLPGVLRNQGFSVQDIEYLQTADTDGICLAAKVAYQL